MALYQGARNRRPNKRPHTHNRKAHPIPRPYTTHILRQRRQNRGKYPLKSRNKEPKAHRPRIQPGLAVNHRPEEQHNGRHEAERNQHVIRPRPPIRDVRWDQPPQNPHAVEHQQNVDTRGVRETEDLHGVRRDVVEGEVLPQPDQENADQEKAVGRFAESGELEQRARFARREARLEQAAVDAAHGEHHEAHDTYGPGEPDAREQLAGDGGIHKAACGAPAGHDGHGHAAVFGEVGGYERDGGGELQATP